MPFEVPSGWVWTTLGSVCNFENGFAFSSDDYKKTGVPLIRISNISDNTIDLNGCVFIQKEIDDRFVVKKGDLLIALSGATTGKMGVYSTDKVAYLNQRVGNLRTIDASVLCHEYRNIFMNSRTEAILKLAYGGAQPNISGSVICSFSFPLPPLAEQQRIASEVNHWFALIDQIDQGKSDLQTIIKQAKSKILNLAIHGKLVPQDPNDEPAIELLKRINPDFTPCDNGHRRKLPQGWAYCQLSNVLKITMGQSPKGDSLNNKTGIEFHQGKICFSDKFLLDSGIYTNEPTKIAEPNSILLCVRAPVGVVNITKNQICIGRGLCALTPFEGNADFYFYLLQTLQDSFDNQSTGTTFKAISGEIIRNENIILPPLAEQQRIVQKIEELFHVLDNIQNALEV